MIDYRITNSPENNIKEAQRCLKALGSAWRGDWRKYDGKILRSQLENIEEVLEDKLSYKEFCEIWYIDVETLEWKD